MCRIIEGKLTSHLDPKTRNTLTQRVKHRIILLKQLEDWGQSGRAAGWEDRFLLQERILLAQFDPP